MVPENVRIRFSKKGRLRYISHLDLCRTMVTAMTRAKIPMWYTEGFNPHPKLVFTQPLPLFAESECEYLDIKIVEPMTHAEIRDRMRAAFTPELYTEIVYTPSTKFTDIAYATYRITAEGYDKALLKGEGELMAEKKGKDGKVRNALGTETGSVAFADKEGKNYYASYFASLESTMTEYAGTYATLDLITALNQWITDNSEVAYVNAWVSNGPNGYPIPEGTVIPELRK